MAIPLPPALPPPPTRALAPRWAAAALAGAGAGALLLLAVGAPLAVPAPDVPRRADAPAVAGRAGAAPGSWRPVGLPVSADDPLSRYPILQQDDTSGVLFVPQAPDQAP